MHESVKTIFVIIHPETHPLDIEEMVSYWKSQPYVSDAVYGVTFDNTRGILVSLTRELEFQF